MMSGHSDQLSTLEWSSREMLHDEKHQRCCGKHQMFLCKEQKDAVARRCADKLTNLRFIVFDIRVCVLPCEFLDYAIGRPALVPGGQ